MKPVQLVTLSLMLFGLVISGCGGNPTGRSPGSEPPEQGSGSGANSPAVTRTPGALAMEPTNPAGAGAIPDEVIEKAKNDLVARLGISKDQVRLVEAKPVSWPDASLGCPQPGMAYAEVITPGYWIVLEVDGMQYPYHTDSESQVILCQEDSLPSFPVTPGEIDDGQPWMPVD